MRRIALATCSALPEGDPDDHVLPEAFAAIGIEADWAIWDDPLIAWAEFDLVLVRSPWDYTDKRDAFLAWAASVPRIANPEPVLAWNTEKLYLGELAMAGLPVVPTRFVAPGDEFTDHVLEGEVVVKPTVSAGARATGRFTDQAAARAHIGHLHDTGAMAMIQPYVPSVDDEGETGLVFLGGESSHAFRKGAILQSEGVAPLVDPVGGLPAAEAMYADETISPRDASREQRALADWALHYVAARFGDLAYARVDMVPGPDGAPVIMELELTEPSLYLGFAPGAAERLAQVIAALLD
ncbi:MAG: hypothetical protein JHC95_06480 [Solirubrobacteraceae bacterium]|nr:hypothetical protein [Solirubrobacteraceae bacterium]